MKLKNNYQAFEEVLRMENITTLYHFTDLDNLASIIAEGGLKGKSYDAGQLFLSTFI